MTTYLTSSDIEIAWRASGSGVCVLVEGETELEDAWFYDRWFGSRAREITFFPQDGWEKVVAAVAELRPRLGARRVYGILDRDFEESLVRSPMPADGILRTPKYTLENYLLDPKCWYSYVQPHTLRTPKPGWNSLAEARTTKTCTGSVCLSRPLIGPCARRGTWTILPSRGCVTWIENTKNIPKPLKTWGMSLAIYGICKAK